MLIDVGVYYLWNSFGLVYVLNIRCVGVLNCCVMISLWLDMCFIFM